MVDTCTQWLRTSVCMNDDLPDLLYRWQGQICDLYSIDNPASYKDGMFPVKIPLILIGAAGIGMGLKHIPDFIRHISRKVDSFFHAYRQNSIDRDCMIHHAKPFNLFKWISNATLLAGGGIAVYMGTYSTYTERVLGGDTEYSQARCLEVCNSITMKILGLN